MLLWTSINTIREEQTRQGRVQTERVTPSEGMRKGKCLNLRWLDTSTGKGSEGIVWVCVLGYSPDWMIVGNNLFVHWRFITQIGLIKSSTANYLGRVFRTERMLRRRQSCQPDLVTWVCSWNPHAGMKELIPSSCSLTSICARACTWIHTKQINTCLKSAGC